VVQLVAPPESAPRQENRGYNRGLILGLTMAESMLLLVFCLLLVAAALITAERNHRRDVEKQLVVAQQQIVELERIKSVAEASAAALQAKIAAIDPSAANEENSEKEWRELVLARQTLDDLKNRGIDPQQLSKVAELAAVLQNHGIKLDAASEQIDQMLHDKDASGGKPHDWPPIINLSEAGGYFFKSGSAELTQAFATKLASSISDQIADNLSRYQVDVIEVIGHTDEQPVSHVGSNLDQTFIDVLGGKKPITAMEPADNAGLGLARAIAVTNVLKANDKLKGATVLPMSAAQLVLPGDVVTAGQAGGVESRRRIEIRIRRRTQSSAL
jgi:flagellar motor protein MotB